MGVVKDLLQDVEIPKFYKVANKMDDTHIEDVAQAVRDALKREGTLDRIKPGSTVCFTAASREIANSVLILRTFAEELKRIGAKPYIVPAMGSHGGATAEGQRAILDHYGITEEACGCEIHATMETKKVGVSAEGLDVRLDAFALSCDYIVPVARIKPHTDFHGPFESGIMKMLAIGLGKQYGASICHMRGFDLMHINVPSFGRTALKNCNIPFAIGLYLPIYLNTSIMIGGVVRWFMDSRKNVDAKLKEEQTTRGTLFCAGMIAGEGLVGILLAVFAVFGISTALSIDLGNIGGVVLMIVMIACLLAFSMKKKKN